MNQRIAQSKITTEEIDRAREEYRSIAKRGSVIYFVISDLAFIDPMYQYSLEFFVKLFKKRLEVTPKKEQLSERLKVLIEDITESFYTNICRGLFEKDKLLFSFMIASKIQLAANKINAKEWNFFLRGSLSEVEFAQEDIPKFLNERIYKTCLQLSTLTPAFKHLIEDLKNP